MRIYYDIVPHFVSYLQLSSGLMEDLTRCPFPSKKGQGDYQCFIPYFHTMLVPFKRLNSRLMVNRKITIVNGSATNRESVQAAVDTHG